MLTGSPKYSVNYSIHYVFSGLTESDITIAVDIIIIIDREHREYGIYQLQHVLPYQSNTYRNYRIIVLSYSIRT